MNRIILVLIILALNLNASKASNEIVRGPYLQDLRSHTVLIRWRSKNPSPTILSYQDSKDATSQEYKSLVLTTNHQARIKKLKADTKYSYKIYGKENSKLKELGKKDSNNFYFHTAPQKQNKNFHTHIWVIGDPGTNGTKKFVNSDKKSQLKVRDAYYQYRKENKIDRTDFILSLGDNAYWSGQDEEYQRGIFEPYKDELRHTPIFTVFGNHDAGLNASDGTYTARAFPKTSGVYFDTFFPANRSYYSFDYTGIHIVVLDSFDSFWEDIKTDQSNYEKIWTPSSDSSNSMLQWLEADLINNKSLWTIVAFHHPPFFRGGDHPNLAIWEAWVQANVVPILNKHQVDLVLTGHIHNYQRSYPLGIEVLQNGTENHIDKKYSRNEYSSEETFTNAIKVKAKTLSSEKEYYTKGDGTVYIVLGSSGAAFNQIKTAANPLVVYGIEEEGSLMLDINATKLSCKFLSKNKEILDKFAINIK